jgi:hypothetical protein
MLKLHKESAAILFPVLYKLNTSTTLTVRNLPSGNSLSDTAPKVPVYMTSLSV